MDTILTGSESNEQLLILVCLCLAVFRIYLEVIGFKLDELPLTAKIMQAQGKSFHKAGLYLSIGYLVLFGPQFLLS